MDSWLGAVTAPEVASMAKLEVLALLAKVLVPLPEKATLPKAEAPESEPLILWEDVPEKVVVDQPGDNSMRLVPNPTNIPFP